MTASDELPAEARAWIDDYVQVHAMPRASFERVGRAISKPVARASVERTAWIVGAVLVAAMLLIVIGSRLFTGREVVADAKDPRELAQDRANAADTEHETRAPDPIPAELPPIAAPRPTPSPIVTPPDAPARVAPPEPTIVAPRSDTLAAERELLETAWDALAAGNGAAAKTIAQRHRTEFPNGQLGDVREAIETLARCAAAPATNRPAILAAFERAHPKSIVLDRVREGCGTE